MEYLLLITIVLLCSLGNRFRGTGVIKHFGTLNIVNKQVHINFNGSHLYGLILASILGLVGGLGLGLTVFIAYIIGEAKGWGEWVGSLTRYEPWDKDLIDLVYKDKEGKTFPFIYYIANFFIKEKVDGTFEEQCAQYKKHATLALILRGIYWWLPIYLIVSLFGLIHWQVALIYSIGLGIAFPLAAAIGRELTYTKVYDLKFIKLSFSRGWENQEIVYGFIQGCVLAFLIYKVHYGL